MKSKKIITTVLALSMMASVFAGCNKDASKSSDKAADKGKVSSEETKRLENINTSGQFPVVKEQITLKVMGARGGAQGEWSNMKFFKVWQDKSNVKLDIITVPKESWDEKKNLTFASNDLPDMFFAGVLEVSDEMNYGAQGMIKPLNNLIDKYAPNVKAIIEKSPDIKKAITTPDGNIYSLPNIDDMNRNLTEKLWINKVWLDKLGLKTPTNLDEFYAVLKAFKEKDPNGNGKADEIPLTFTEDGFRKTLAYWGIKCDTNMYLGANEKAKKIYYAPMEPAYKEYLTFYNKLYKEGIVDKESFTQNATQMKAKGNEANLLLGAFISPGPFITVPTKNNEDYIALPPLKTAKGEQQWSKASGLKRGTFTITNKNKNPEASVKMVDWVYGKEGALTLMRGVANEDFKYTNAAQTECELIIPKEFASFEEHRAKNLTPNSGSITPGIGGGTLPQVVNPLNTYIDKQVEQNLMPYWSLTFPDLYLSASDQKQVATIGADINTNVKEMSARFITGDLAIDSNYDKFIAELKKMGAEKYLSIYQAAYEASLKVK